MICAAFLAAIASGAAAADPAPREPVWVTRPGPGDLERATPEAGRAAGGAASVGCEVARDGALVACAIRSEQPEGAGFGDAALSLVSKMRMQPNWSDGSPAAGAHLLLPFSFKASPPLLQVRGRRGGTFAGAGPYYPERAYSKGISGEAAIDCLLSADGRLQDCNAAWEAPTGENFADAARVMAKAQAITATPRLVDNQPIADERVRVIVPFGAARH